MSSMTLLLLVVLIIVISGIGIWYTVKVGREQPVEHDGDVSQARMKHKLSRNPVLLAYALFPVLVILGAIFIYLFTGG
ncbi:hypothetical protein [Marinicrinis sediminis]|uniref:Uncharacterized protein n=1 Tax=Marinicrinis sediminis TaxID=1652465 RepID=A0ABW5RFB5_9BACL